MGLLSGRDDRRRRYITAQVEQIAPRFSEDGIGVHYDVEHCNWVLIPKYPMPSRWKQRWTSLLIWFGTGYPDTPPTGFYLNIRAGLKSGGRDKHLFNRSFYDAPDLSAQGWFWYCVRANLQTAGGWQPADDPTASDNLWTFLNLCREALTVDD